jgi:hypothetical protein
VAEHLDVAAIGPTQTLKTLDSRCLACAVGSENSEDLALFDREADIIDGDK